MPALAADILRIPADGQFDLPIGEQLDLLVDPQRSYTLSQVQHSRDFRLVRTNDLTLDFNRGRYWLRFGLSNSSTQERNAVLRIRPSHLDHLRLFTLDGREIQPVNTRGIARSPNLFSLSIAPQ
ncbi:7TM-DISM domain-containing protein, partial [Litorivivens sp.]|uniref:7TMR-DISMED2 domain-containing protein n=1 Tax=Litorivivens sp. TaxID=2020868 RepID=UPI00356A29DD